MGAFKFFESKQLDDWGIRSDKWIKNARKIRRKLLFLLVDALMKLCYDIVRFENVLIRQWKYFEYKFSFIKKVFQKITSLKNKIYERNNESQLKELH